MKSFRSKFIFTIFLTAVPGAAGVAMPPPAFANESVPANNNQRPQNVRIIWTMRKSQKSLTEKWWSSPERWIIPATRFMFKKSKRLHEAAA